MSPKPRSSSSKNGAKSAATPPREAWMQHLTHSGYLKVEVYADLKKCLLEKDHTRLCYRVAELACTKGELPNLYDALIEAHAKYFLSSNTWILDRVLAIIGILKALPKKNLVQNIAFQKHVSEWALLLSVQHVKVASTFGFDIRPMSIGDQASMAAEHARIESLALSHPTPSRAASGGSSSPPAIAYNRLHDALYNRVSHDIYKRFTALYKALQDQCFKDVQSIVRFLLCTKEHFVDEITYDAIDTVKRPLRKDMVWYVWRILSIFSQDCVEIPLLNAYVMRALAIYAFQYKKKHRLTRIPFLMYACWIACHVSGSGSSAAGHTKLRLRHQETSYPLQEAVQHVHIVFAEILGLPEARDEEEIEEDDYFADEDARDDARDVGRDARDVGRDARDVGRDARDVGRDARDIGRDGRDVGRDGRDVGRDGRDVGRDGRDVGRDQKKPTSAQSKSKMLGKERDLSTYAPPLPPPRAPMPSGLSPPSRQGRAALKTNPSPPSEDLRYLKVCTYYDPDPNE